MNFRKIVLTGICLFFCLVVCGHAAGQYRFDTWTTDNGLPQNGLRQITQTPDGYLWFTTYDGLVRFDGVRFTTFNKNNTPGIINNRFTGLYCDEDGTLYATTIEDGVLTIFRNGTFTSMTSDQVPGDYIAEIDHFPDGSLRCRVEEGDRKSDNYYRLSDGKFEFVESKLKVYHYADYTGPSGTKWEVRINGVTELRPDGKTIFYPLDMSTVSYWPNPFEDSSGNFWIGESKIHRLRDGHIKTFGKSDGLPDNTIYHSEWEESDGSIWFASGGSLATGVGLIQLTGDSVAIWGKNDGFTNRHIQSVFRDREGTVWLATDKGLSRRRKEVMRTYSTADGLDHSEIYPLLRDRDDNIWIGSSKGISIYRDGKFQPLHITPSIEDAADAGMWRDGVMSVQALWQDPHGVMWVGVDGGIYLIQEGTARRIFEGPHVSAINADKDGDVWAATSAGLIRFRDYKVVERFRVADGLPNDFMTCIFTDSKGGLWFGGFGGLTKFENGRFINYTTKEGLAGNYVRTIYEDADGTLWIGTYDEGMSRYKNGQFVNLKERNGLYSSGVFAIEEDSAGYFWISSNHGIYRVKRQELNDLADGRIEKFHSIGYGKEDGMLSIECNGGRQPASLRDKTGKFWFPTQDGVVVLDPLAEKPNLQLPSVVIEDILVERKPVDFRNGVAIEPGQNDLEIRYTGISLIKADQVKFKYKLEGHDEDWVDAGTRRTANYSYLPPGNYTFRVMAANSDGLWGEKSSTVKLELKPYFYQTTAFYIIVALLVVLGFLAAWKISVHQMKARERRLTKLVNERTAELAAANETLQNLAHADGLTKIGNRRKFESFLADEWHRAVRFKTEISLVMLDIDHFKLYNDTYGHLAGDDCLKKVAEAFAEAIKRPTDLVARFGGEEFAIVLGGTDAEGAMNIAQQAVDNLKDLQISHSLSATSEILTVSVGIATIFATLENSEADLIEIADKALYNAKRNGRNCIYVHDSSVQVPHVHAGVLRQEHNVRDSI